MGQVFFSVALLLLNKMSMHAPAESKHPGYAASLLLQAFSKVQLGSKRPAVSIVAFHILPQPFIFFFFPLSFTCLSLAKKNNMHVHVLPNSLPGD